MTTAAPTDNLESEIKQIEAELQQAIQAAARAKLNSADHEAAFLSERLQAKKQELQARQEAESLAYSEQQHREALAALRELEQEILAEKVKLDGLRTQYGQLASEIQQREFRHGSLLRALSQAKQKLGV